MYVRKLLVFVVSDSVGETGESVVRAVLSQFRPDFQDVEIVRFPHLTTITELNEVVREAKERKAMIVYTLVSHQLREMFYAYAKSLQVIALDLLGPIMQAVEQEYNEKPIQQPGIVHQLDDDYFKKIEAIEFAVKYDDGRDPRGILLADIVIIGVSRTSKTPLSQYLAHKSFKVANVPLVPEIDPPKELFEVDPNKCFGLVISPDQLNCIRKERLLVLGLKDEAIYAQKERIEQELQHFYSVANRVGCQIIDVTNKAVEESANLIIDVLNQHT